MLIVENPVLLKLEELMTRNKIEEKVKIFKDKDYWYKHSYGTFIKRFDETRGRATSEAWTERTALVYSWLPRIPLQSFNLKPEDLNKIINSLTKLEAIYFDADLSNIGNIKFSNQETIFSLYKGCSNLSIKKFLELGGRLLHSEARLNTQLSSTTKLLHFMCPGLFPIFDTKVCNKIFGTNYQTYDRYNTYIFSLQQYLEEGTEAAHIKEIANNLGVSPLYIIDLVIFDTKLS